MTGKEIKELRKRLGWTQEKMAEKLDVAVSTVNRWEKNRARPSRLALRQLDRLARMVS